MAVVYTQKDFKFGMHLEDDFDAVPTSAAWRQIAIENIEIMPTVDIIRPPRAVGHRQQDYQDADATTKGAEMLVTVPSYDVVWKDLSFWLLAAMQNYSQYASSPYSKIFTPHSTDPDFAADSGTIMHLCAKHPATSSSFLALNCVVRELTVSLSADNIGRRLMVGATLLARDIDTNYQPTCTTFSRADTGAQSYWGIDSIKGTYGGISLGADTIDDNFYALEFTYRSGAVGIGYDSSGRPQRFALPDVGCSGTLRLARNPVVGSSASADKYIADWTAGTNRVFGITLKTTADLGDTAGDINIQIPMQFTNISNDRANEEIVVIEFEAVKTATLDVLKIILADAQDLAALIY